jgi:outer membrane lipoprotein carrier protein
MIHLVALLLVFLQTPSGPSAVSGTALVEGISRTFKNMKDFSADFEQVFRDSLNRSRAERGHLYLMKSRMMRWEYSTPEEKLFVSDGKTVYSYFPEDRLVHRDKVSDAVDERMPLMFLLGRSDLRDEFTQIRLMGTPPVVPNTKVLRMIPKRKTDLKEVEMEVDPATYQIGRLILVYSDGSHSDFKFSNIQTNTGLKASIFDFKVPNGVEVRDGIGQ